MTWLSGPVLSQFRTTEFELVVPGVIDVGSAGRRAVTTTFGAFPRTPG